MRQGLNFQDFAPKQKNLQAKLMLNSIMDGRKKSQFHKNIVEEMGSFKGTS